MSTLAQRQRPGVVTLIGLLIWVQAILAGVAAFAAFAFRNDSDFQASAGLDADQILGVAIGEAILAVVLVILAISLMGGSSGARTFVGVVEIIRIGVAAWWIVTHHTGGFMSKGLITIGVGILVLWALYGNEKSDEYFRGY